ncbi:hypothetical protein Lfu02_49360 [Longispora fulva]|uniref:Uncharacterized protein (TIGR02679 family) n=1 Tax=Longispora fulva TaxID=619741 RepID=A0A8J7GU62_9ACTN|nr:TIGR02679 family protein [Longispora fulva]MBG6138313.1 uncharacterized protein (TIGR02679 family) [Longispora fulva]GIG60564.1 hypothetical protein Lfu02_49360 [Longispora fulva]
MIDPDRLRRLLGGTDTAWLIQRTRRRIELGQPLTGTITHNRPSPQERRAVESLLGRPPGRGTSLTVSLDEIDAALRRSGAHPDGLHAAVTLLLGPITHRASAETALAEAWDTALAPLATLIAQRPELRAWYDEPRTAALIRRIGGSPAEAAPLMVALARVLAGLPAAGVALSRYAADTTTDEHALDQGRPLAALALSAIRETWSTGDHPDTTPAQRRRALWDTVGVLLDELSSTVLALNLPAAPGTRLGRQVAVMVGEPVVLTLRQLAREPVRYTKAQVFVCENPAIVAAAADLLDADCPPLVCVNGQPSTATMRLLEALHHDGAELAYHGDFDWGGLRIANLLGSRIPWRPWRYTSADYLAAVAADQAGRALAGTPVDARWDPQLRDVMMAHGRRVAEERVLTDLLTDLTG